MIFLGIHSDGETLKVAKIRKENKNISIEILRTLPQRDSGSYVKPLYNLESILGKEFKIVTGLEPEEVFIRTLQMKLLDKRKVLATLPFQLEGLVPFSLDEAFIASQVVKENDSASSRVQVTAVKQQLVQTHLEKMQNFDIDPDFVSSIPSSLCRYYSYFYPSKPDVFFFYFGTEQSAALSFSSGKLEFSYPFSFGIENLVQALSQDDPMLSRQELLEKTYSIDLQGVSPSQSPHLFEALFELQKEIDRIISYFQSKPCGKNTTNVLLAGSFSSFSKFRDFFKHSLPSHFEMMESPSFGPYDESTLESYASAVGLALDAAMSDGNSLQLRQKQFLSQQTFRKRATSLAYYYAACAALAGCLFISCKLFLSKKEDTIKSVYANYFPEGSSSDLAAQVSALEKKIGKQKKSTALAFTAPNVSEVLAWLSTHPKLTRNTDSLIDIELIEIRHLRYQIVKLPTLNSPSTVPVVKVELEFNSPSSRIAREFHEALLKGDALVDEKKEIPWQVKDSVYRTSFFVKPKGAAL